jgi:hypothetical protein
VFRNVKVTAPIETFSSRSTTSGTNFTANQITATYAHEMLVSACQSAPSSGTQTLTQPTGTTLVGKSSIGAQSVGMAYIAGPAASAATTIAAWTGSTSTFSATHGLVLLRPSDT